MDSPFIEEIEKLGGKIYKLPKFNGRNYLFLRAAWNHFFKEHPYYHILHSHVRSYASLYLPVARKNGVKTIIHSHSTSNGGGLSAIIKSILQYPLRFQADYYFACSKYAGEWLYGKRIVSAKNFMIIANAIDAEKYRFSVKTRQEIRDELKIPSNAFVVGNVGRFTQAKNHSFIIECFKVIHDSTPNSYLLLVGTGESKEKIEEQERFLNLQNNVILTGVRNDIPQLLFAMDVFLFPSLWEGLGIVAIEARASGLPVICSDAIPKETKVTDIIKYIPINTTMNNWKKAIMMYQHYDRKDRIEEIRKAGFDIKETSKWLERFYIKISKRYYENTYTD